MVAKQTGMVRYGETVIAKGFTIIRLQHSSEKEAGGAIECSTFMGEEDGKSKFFLPQLCEAIGGIEWQSRTVSSLTE
jgi:hypothetical protein